MRALRLAAFVVPLGFDTFAVAVALGIGGCRRWRPLVLFTLFETIMPLLGVILGRMVGGRSSVVAGYLGGLILWTVGFKTIRKTLAACEQVLELDSLDSLKGSLFAALGISLDDIAIGFPLGTGDIPVALVVGAIAVQTFVVTCVGLSIGGRIGSALGASASRAAGMAAGTAFLLLGSLLIAEQAVPNLHLF